MSTFPPNPVPLNVPEAEAGVYRYDLARLKANKPSETTIALADRKSYEPNGQEILYARSLAGDLDYVPITVECEVIFPKKIPPCSPFFFDTPFVVSSLFGIIHVLRALETYRIQVLEWAHEIFICF